MVGAVSFGIACSIVELALMGWFKWHRNMAGHNIPYAAGVSLAFSYFIGAMFGVVGVLVFEGAIYSTIVSMFTYRVVEMWLEWDKTRWEGDIDNIKETWRALGHGIYLFVRIITSPFWAGPHIEAWSRKVLRPRVLPVIKQLGDKTRR